MSRKKPKSKLQPLRVPSGWMITINNLYEVEATNESIQEWYSSSVLIGGTRIDNGYCFDAQFTGETLEEGEFFVGFFKIKYDKFDQKIEEPEILISKYSTKSKLELIEKIEDFMMQH